MLRTDRLLLRPWRPDDRSAFARMNADPAVTEFLVAPLTREESDAFADRIEGGLAEHGFGMWAVEEAETGAFLGYAGLLRQSFRAPFTPAVEVGYRLAPRAWGHGYATEAAQAALGFGFEQAALTEIVSMTAVGNSRSRRVMERLGMTHDSRDDFDHPRIPDGHPLKRHVLYRISDAGWRAQQTRQTGQEAR